MKEIVKPFTNCPWTDLLDPHGDKPYLVFDQNSGQYHVLYWKAFFHGNKKWYGSDWFDAPNADETTKPSRKANSWPLPIKVFEFTTIGDRVIQYDPPTNYTGETKRTLTATG